MTAPVNIAAYSDALVVLGTAGIVVPLVRRFGFSPVLGYLGAGALLGPLGLGSLKTIFPLLYWVTVVDIKNVAGIAELGVVFLLFLIGLELSYERLHTMRHLVFGLGGLQIVVSTALLGTGAWLLGSKPGVALVIGACLALSSTAIVVELLSQQRRLTTAAGRASFAVLLAQDLAVVPLLLLIAMLGAGSGGSIVNTVLFALANAALAIGVIVVVGRVVLRPLFRLVASTGASELFVAAILFVIVATGVIAALADLSMALGAFVAGLLLAETEYRKAIEATIEPFKGLLLGVFFFTVGMGIDIAELAYQPVRLLGAVAGVIAVKVAVLFVLARLFGKPWAAAVETALLLGPGGEFAFVGIGSATTLGLIGAGVSSFVLTVTSLTMALIPALSLLARWLTARAQLPVAQPAELGVTAAGRQGHAIVVGYGRVGAVVAAMLAEHKVAFIALDPDPVAVAEGRRAGHQVYFGDAVSAALMKSCELEKASAVIVTTHERRKIDEMVTLVRELRPDIMIIARARDAAHARHLYSEGVTDAVPETVEASLQLSEAALVGLGIPTGPVIASIHEKRDGFRGELQAAAGAAGRDATRSIRPKLRRPGSA